MDVEDGSVRLFFRQFWHTFFKESQSYAGHLVSIECLFNLLSSNINIKDILKICDVRQLYPLESHFNYKADSSLKQNNCYSVQLVEAYDRQLSARFHHLLPQIVEEYRHQFIDQLRCTHFLGMAGNEAIMLYPSQQKRLFAEQVQTIAGEVRNIQTGFGNYRFNAPSPQNLPNLLAIYADKVEHLLKEANESNIHYLASFAQYYFTLLHPFYERCGRTSEELMYLIFEKVGYGWRYISARGDRSSQLANERMHLINEFAEEFNRKIAHYFGLQPQTIRKTPDIYQALTETYFPEHYSTIYCSPNDKPYYYIHPVPEILTAYYFLMEGLLLDELTHFSLEQPYSHILRLGNHLRDYGNTHYYMPTGYNDNLNLRQVLADIAGQAIFVPAKPDAWRH
ncbi:MAG: Fic family protein [Candidatus Thiocaldithrix dubininis]|uniref:Fic family protein n=1 Tax=Candidatus Thiocaldithrix dubininis TaxID=3080823 RepID=A0AA95H897_9GAMM|nr:MAG: Fic family protein [Candidatus Thiocaldithrix dubininis]